MHPGKISGQQPLVAATPQTPAIEPVATAISPFMLIQHFKEKADALHQNNRQQFWNRLLPFYTLLTEETGINRKEYPNGHTELVYRRMDAMGNFTDEPITDDTLIEKYL